MVRLVIFYSVKKVIHSWHQVLMFNLMKNQHNLQDLLKVE